MAGRKKYRETVKGREKIPETGGLEIGGLEAGDLETGGLETGDLEIGGLEAGDLQARRLQTGKRTSGQRTSARKTALFGLLTALAFVLGYVESLVPVYLGAPGVKLGLANLVTMVGLYCMGVKETALISVVRVLLSGFLFGPPSAILFGLSGTALSLTVMAVYKRFRLFGMVGVSILGGVAHNIGQFLMAAFVVHTFGVFSYLPVLLGAGCAAGALIGLLGGILVGRVNRFFWPV